MTLPFRRRHHDNEASHDRARAIVATGFQEPMDPADAAWLETHLAGCGECRAEMDAYRSDRELLRSLRDHPVEAPRDLWARTAASIEREAGRRDRPPLALRSGPRLGRIPLGVASGVLVVLVVLATSLMPQGGPIPLGSPEPGGSAVAVGSPRPDATPLVVTAKAISWVEGSADGTFQLVFAQVDEVCTAEPEACAPLDDASSTRLTLRGDPQSVVLSPSSEQLVVVTAATSAGGGEVTIVPVPGAASTPVPSLDPAASPPVAETPPPATTAPEPTPVTTAGPAVTPGPGETQGPGETSGPDAPRAILTGVIVVGEAAYSADGQWLAFSARPIDGSAGPDLYLWHAGDPVATAATTDHRTFFVGWLGERVLASRVVTAEPPAVVGSPDAPSAVPAAPEESPKPGKTPKPGGPKANATAGATPEPTGAVSPDASPGVTEPPVEDHPASFLLDPWTSAVTELAGLDVWRPVVSPTSRTIVYWSGTLVPDGSGTGWTEGAGRLVLDGWVDPAAAPAPSPDAGTSPAATATPDVTPEVTTDPLATAEPVRLPGPAGFPVTLAEGPVTAFEASFDPSGTRLAVWVADPASLEVGTLRLYAIDAATGGLRPDVDPLPGVAALRGFSIDAGRLAWVTPPGQNGETSHVHVLAWMGDEFGQVRSIAADGAFFVR